VLAATLLYVLGTWLLESFLPMRYALWIAFMAFFFFRGMLQWWMFRRGGWELR
jgi:Na+-driven multidrug efflux pump